jgi:hypothetical protein
MAIGSCGLTGCDGVVLVPVGALEPGATLVLVPLEGWRPVEELGPMPLPGPAPPALGVVGVREPWLRLWIGALLEQAHTHMPNTRIGRIRMGSLSWKGTPRLRASQAAV